ncbi:MAG: hypothetical protein QW207_03365 [Candidatus Micrarchaeaceae archaeon]
MDVDTGTSIAVDLIPANPNDKVAMGRFIADRNLRWIWDGWWTPDIAALFRGSLRHITKKEES